MISIKSEIVKDAISKYKLEIEVQRLNAYNNLVLLKKKRLSKEEIIYVDKIIKEFKTNNILIGKPSYLDKVKKRVGVVPVNPRLTTKEKRDKRRTDLKDMILTSLGYKGLRTSFYPKFFKEIGIKACVYCNSQLAVSIDVEEHLKTEIKTKVKAKFQVDHYLAKDEYPFLSISLFNLYPACASCNIAKSKIQIKEFKLYSESKNILPSKYHFHFQAGCVADYLTTLDVEKIKVLFVDPNKPDRTKFIKGSFQDTFDIEGIYDTQNDIAEEIIIKAQTYSDSLKQKLINDFPKLYPNKNHINRILLGNYIEEANIHKRPMAKYMQDIAKELGLF